MKASVIIPRFQTSDLAGAVAICESMVSILIAFPDGLRVGARPTKSDVQIQIGASWGGCLDWHQSGLAGALSGRGEAYSFSASYYGGRRGSP